MEFGIFVLGIACIETAFLIAVVYSLICQQNKVNEILNRAKLAIKKREK